MAKLEKKQTLLKIHPEQHTDTHTYFQYEGDDDAYRVGYYMPMVDWVNMGCPEEITVASIPGDKMENNIGLRDAGEYVEWDIDRNMSIADAEVFDRGVKHALRMLDEVEAERSA